MTIPDRFGTPEFLLGESVSMGELQRIADAVFALLRRDGMGEASTDGAGFYLVNPLARGGHYARLTAEQAPYYSWKMIRWDGAEYIEPEVELSGTFDAKELNDISGLPADPDTGLVVWMQPGDCHGETTAPWVFDGRQRFAPGDTIVINNITEIINNSTITINNSTVNISNTVINITNNTVFNFDGPELPVVTSVCPIYEFGYVNGDPVTDFDGNPLRFLTGFTVERRLLTLLPGTLLSDVYCEDDPDECCLEDSYYQTACIYDCTACPGGAPPRWQLVINGVTDDVCGDCGAYNGTWTLSHVGGCTWRSEAITADNCHYGNLNDYIYLEYDDVHAIWYLTVGENPIVGSGDLGAAAFNCLGTNVFLMTWDEFADVISCAGPATLTLTPLPNDCTGGGGGESNTITAPCCPDNLLPASMGMSFGGGLAGVGDVALTWNPTLFGPVDPSCPPRHAGWEGTGTGCGGNFTVQFYCNLGFDCDVLGWGLIIVGSINYLTGVAEVDCAGFEATGDILSGMGAPCTAGTFTITGSSSGGTNLPCCPDVSIPLNLNVTFSGGAGGCAGLDGQTVIVNWDGVDSWTYAGGAINGTTADSVTLQCVGTSWLLTLACGVTTGTATLSILSCRPMHLFGDLTACCGSSIHFDVTE